MGLVRKTFTASGSLAIPAGVTQVFVLAIGGGGGGCGGQGGRYNIGVAYNASGGGGGAAGNLVEGWYDVTPGETLGITVGSGGAATPGGTTGGNDVDVMPNTGNDGADTVVTRGNLSLMVQARGGGAGRMAQNPDMVTGNPTAQGGSPFFAPGLTTAGRWVSNNGQFGFGGRGGTGGSGFASAPVKGASNAGRTSSVSNGGGTSTASRNAGTAGGSGAPGPLETAFNPAGQGGAGAQALAAGTNGANGTTGAGYGAGGGGGGGGQGATNAQVTGNGGAGAAGASGYVEIGWYE